MKWCHYHGKCCQHHPHILCMNQDFILLHRTQRIKKLVSYPKSWCLSRVNWKGEKNPFFWTFWFVWHGLQTSALPLIGAHSSAEGLDETRQFQPKKLNIALGSSHACASLPGMPLTPFAAEMPGRSEHDLVPAQFPVFLSMWDLMVSFYKIFVTCSTWSVQVKFVYKWNWKVFKNLLTIQCLRIGPLIDLK